MSHEYVHPTLAQILNGICPDKELQMAAHNYPCRVTADLRIYEREQEQAVELYDLADHAERALEVIHDGEKLSKILNDSELAPHLAEALAGLEAAGQEVSDKDCPITKLVLSRLARLEKVLFNIAMETL